MSVQNIGKAEDVVGQTAKGYNRKSMLSTTKAPDIAIDSLSANCANTV